METLRTPDERFEKLPGFDHEPHYTEVPDGEGGSLRIHHVDVGPRDGQVVLCMHGQPTWSFLYRKMIAVFHQAGLRTIAPDLVGFGRSDKPTREEDYSYERHVGWMWEWLQALDLRDVTLFGQDWGGLIGLRVVAEHPERFARVVAANTGLPTGPIPAAAVPAMRELYEKLPVVPVEELGQGFTDPDAPPGQAFLLWQKFCAESGMLPVARIVDGLRGKPLPADVFAAYDAPFPDERYQAGARKFPRLVPIFGDDPAVPANEKAWESLRHFEKPFLTAFSDNDPVTRGGEKRFQEEIPGAKDQEHPTIRSAGHFLQEDAGEKVAAEVIRFVERTPLPT